MGSRGYFVRILMRMLHFYINWCCQVSQVLIDLLFDRMYIEFHPRKISASQLWWNMIAAERDKPFSYHDSGENLWWLTELCCDWHCSALAIHQIRSKWQKRGSVMSQVAENAAQNVNSVSISGSERCYVDYYCLGQDVWSITTLRSIEASTPNWLFKARPWTSANSARSWP